MGSYPRNACKTRGHKVPQPKMKNQKMLNLKMRYFSLPFKTRYFLPNLRWFSTQGTWTNLTTEAAVIAWASQSVYDNIKDDFLGSF